ncbi:MAG: DUF1211 domain-containing protein [Fimbriimonadaceae bacterium]|nr:DUF1211 domain-containing protein [Fimbriimonadaceae bacterium]QYK57998.1 MAG: DUF1211 domain-containing protein [Fimbriimonadaceae bacterium]
MTRNRLEAFSDGVLAIVITIMVLELKVPHEPTIEAVRPLADVFMSYVLSFVFISIYWNNHHHMMHLVQHVSGKILWANLHLLFWLSLVPFVTGWLGENGFAKLPTAAYGIVLFFAGVAYWILENTIVRHQGPGSPLGQAVGFDLKGKASIAIYVVGVACSFWNQWVSIALYALVAAMWLVPDRRIESRA